MQGYYRQPEETAHALQQHGDKLWLRTRDLAYRDEEGYVYIVGRVDDLINIGGVKVYPREIEDVLHRHPDVEISAVTGIPSTLHHEAIQAFVVLKPNAQCTREDLLAFCRPCLADFKIPRHVTFVESLPARSDRQDSPQSASRWALIQKGRICSGLIKTTGRIIRSGQHPTTAVRRSLLTRCSAWSPTTPLIRPQDSHPERVVARWFQPTRSQIRTALISHSRDSKSERVVAQ